MDEYTEPYADDPKIMELRVKEAIIYECRKASSDPDDDTALTAVLGTHPNAADLFSDPELTEFIRSWRTPRGDISGRHAVDCGLFTLELQIQERIEELFFESVYRPLIDASPANVNGLSRVGFLGALFPEGRSVLMLDTSKEREGLPWNTGMGEDVGGEWFWPLPVAVTDDTEVGIVKNPDVVSLWSSATANISVDDLVLMREKIIRREIPVRLVMTTPYSITVIFTVGANSQHEWRAECRRLRSDLQELGVSCPPFRYDWTAPMIHSPLTRLVYFSPQ